MSMLAHRVLPFSIKFLVFLCCFSLPPTPPLCFRSENPVSITDYLSVPLFRFVAGYCRFITLENCYFSPHPGEMQICTIVLQLDCFLKRERESNSINEGQVRNENKSQFHSTCARKILPFFSGKLNDQSIHIFVSHFSLPDRWHSELASDLSNSVPEFYQVN